MVRRQKLADAKKPVKHFVSLRLFFRDVAVSKEDVGHGRTFRGLPHGKLDAVKIPAFSNHLVDDTFELFIGDRGALFDFIAHRVILPATMMRCQACQPSEPNLPNSITANKQKGC